MELEGQVALVTGASRGIGRAIAMALLESGATVYGSSRRPEAVDWPEGMRSIALDLSSRAFVEEAWRRQGLGGLGISILVNNAGSGAFGPFQEAAFSQWSEQVEQLLLAPMYLAQKVLAGGRCRAIVNVTSLACEYPIPYMSAYNTAKAGLAAFSESLEMELGAACRVLELRVGDMHTSFNEHVERSGQAGALDLVWRSMERDVATAPDPRLVGAAVARALREDRRGCVRVGSFFQAWVASLFGRVLPASWKRSLNLRYYGLER